jgi:hypothetical protein
MNTGPSFQEQLAADLTTHFTRTAGAPNTTPLPASGEFTIKEEPENKATASGSNAPTLLTRFFEKIAPRQAPGTGSATNNWDLNSNLLRVNGVMQTGTQIFATVNQQVVKVNDEITIDLNGRTYHFRVRRINFYERTVNFERIE